MATKKILVIGFGNMAKATFNGIDPAHAPYELTVVKPSPLRPDDTRLPAQYYSSISALPEGYKPDIVLFACKPPHLEQVLPVVAGKFQGQSPLYVSMIASKPFEAYHGALGNDAKVVRVMPNLPIAVRAGVTLVCPSARCSQADIKASGDLFAGASKILHCGNEVEFNHMTVLTGCTPGFMFQLFDGFLKGYQKVDTAQTRMRFLESMLATAQYAQAHPDVPFTQLTRQPPEGTSGAMFALLDEIVGGMQEKAPAMPKAECLQIVIGSARYAQLHPELTLEQMADQVATKGGLTEAGLKSMRANTADMYATPQIVKGMIATAVQAALDRGEELANGGRKKP